MQIIARITIGGHLCGKREQRLYEWKHPQAKVRAWRGEKKTRLDGEVLWRFKWGEPIKRGTNVRVRRQIVRIRESDEGGGGGAPAANWLNQHELQHQIRRGLPRDHAKDRAHRKGTRLLQVKTVREVRVSPQKDRRPQTPGDLGTITEEDVRGKDKEDIIGQTISLLGEEQRADQNNGGKQVAIWEFETKGQRIEEGSARAGNIQKHHSESLTKSQINAGRQNNPNQSLSTGNIKPPQKRAHSQVIQRHSQKQPVELWKRGPKTHPKLHQEDPWRRRQKL